MSNTSTTIEKLKTAIESVTGNPVGEIDIHGNIKSQLALDSMQFVQLFSALEEALNVELPLSIMNVQTVSQFVDILEKETSLTNI